MLGFVVLISFVVATLAAICVILLKKRDAYFTGKHQVVCPENREPAQVQVNTRLALRSLLTDVEQLKLQGCSRWPEKEGCGEECLLQIDLNPAVLNRVLADFYEGKSCPLCRRALHESDWKFGRFAMLDDRGQMICGGDLPLREFPAALARFRPVCWVCHEQERARRAVPTTLLKGDRRGRQSDPILSE